MENLDFELNLKRKMIPVQPDPDFVERLNQRLRTQKRVILEQKGDSIAPVLVTAGLLLGIGLVFLITGRYRRK
jgi:hypothetical protein